MRVFIALVIAVAGACGGKIDDTSTSPPSRSSSDGTVRACDVMYLACSNGDVCTQKATCGSTQTCRCENDRWACDDPCTPPPGCTLPAPGWSCPLYMMRCPISKACHSKTPECVCNIHNEWSCPADLYCDH